MRRLFGWCAVAAAVGAVLAAGGCTKRYIPRVTEEIIDPGVPVYSETIVE
ncbi:MAG: hypothetical protein PHN82_10385 [bacterium]|nr:hypothetical protein [bacterium]